MNIPVSVSEILTRGRILSEEEQNLVTEEMHELMDTGRDSDRLNRLGDLVLAFEAKHEVLYEQ